MSPIDDSAAVKLELSRHFVDWRDGLRDQKAKARIQTRLLALSRGHWGDVKSVGDGVSELRIHFGPGYRVYVARRGPAWVILLCGGDKDSQPRDIMRAKALARELRDGA